jgi:hypothetical protein
METPRKPTPLVVIDTLWLLPEVDTTSVPLALPDSRSRMVPPLALPTASPLAPKLVSLQSPETRLPCAVSAPCRFTFVDCVAQRSDRLRRVLPLL